MWHAATKPDSIGNICLPPGKITGGCGRLLCCLNYEYSNYIEAAKSLPPVGSSVVTPDGIAKIASICFLKQKITVKLEDGKIKQFEKEDIEMLDQEVNIEIGPSDNLMCCDKQETADIKNLDNDKNSSTGNI